MGTTRPRVAGRVKALYVFDPGPDGSIGDLSWVVEAKQDETRANRLNQAIAWMAEGKSRNWKYAKC